MDDLKQKVEELNDEIAKKENKITELNNELEKKEIKINELSEIVTEKEKIIDEQKEKLETVESQLSEMKPPEQIEYTSEERLVCPNCGAKGKDLKVEEDKTKVLSYVGHSPLYAKINVCKKCGYKF